MLQVRLKSLLNSSKRDKTSEDTDLFFFVLTILPNNFFKLGPSPSPFEVYSTNHYVLYKFVVEYTTTQNEFYCVKVIVTLLCILKSEKHITCELIGISIQHMILL